MPDIKFECEDCTQRIEVPGDMLGTTIVCPRCAKRLTVTEPKSTRPSTVVRDAPKTGMKERKEKEKSSVDNIVSGKACPDCGGRIGATATTCHHCGKVLRVKKPRSSTGEGQDFEKQAVVLGGFVCLLIGIILCARQTPKPTYLPLFFLSFVLGILSMTKRQLAAGIILVIATVVVPLSILQPRPQLAQAPEPTQPTWTESIPRPVPTQPRRRPITKPVPTPTLPEIVGPPPPPASTTTTTTPKPTFSDDPFRDAFGPPAATPSPDNTPTPTGPEPAVTSPPDNTPTPAPSSVPLLESDRICQALVQNPESKALLAKLKNEIRAIANPDKKVRLVAAYCLGSLLTGNQKDAAATHAYLKKYYPKTSALKMLSLEQTTNPCAKCFGAGRSDNPCSTCKGSGKCNRCGGSGTKTLSGMDGSGKKVRCVSCQGTGKCRKCKGASKIKGKCKDCRGTGKTFAPEKVKQAYLSLLSGTTNVTAVP